METYTKAIWSKYLADSNELLRIRDKENNPIHAHFAGVTHRRYEDYIQGLTPISRPEISEMQ